jgi:hypothetical protein
MLVGDKYTSLSSGQASMRSEQEHREQDARQDEGEDEAEPTH